MKDTFIHYCQKQPNSELSGFVESYWMLENRSNKKKEVVVLPDGRVDVFFSKSLHEPFHTSLSGIDTHATIGSLEPKTITFAISFKLLAAEHLFGKYLANIVNTVIRIPNGLNDFSETDLNDFDSFCHKVDALLIQSFSKIELDNRKQKLFQLVYDSKGVLPVKEIAENIFWSTRQINRYFNDYFGLNLKAYCNILRFRASFTQIKEGKFFPEENFSDQSHFIKEIKKHSNVTPKELHKNKNDRFIQFSLLT